MKLVKIIKVKINENAGSCYKCQIFQDDFKYYINGKYHYCSIKCFLHYYPNGELIMIWNILTPTIRKPETRSQIIKKLSKAMEARGW